jgi:heme-degrading monooxygenase HmoA
MFASIRRYRMHKGSMDELARRVDEGFAEEICAQPGFVSYEFVDCGDGEVMTISIFREAGGAAGSRDLAQRWTDENLRDLEFTRMGALDGEILVSRANEDMLEPGHVGAARKFASARRYGLRDGSVAALMHKVDEIFADRIERLDGFEAYHALDCGRGEIMSISLFRDQASAEASDDLALQFVGEELGEFDIERTEVIGGEVIVSRAMAELLEPAHA